MARRTYIKEAINGRWTDLYQSDRVNGHVPKESGIYAFISCNIFTKEKRVVYIGKSTDLSVRLKPWHPVERKDPPEECFLYCKVMLTNNQDVKELEYIKRLKPLFNIQHNPKIKRKIIYTYE